MQACKHMGKGGACGCKSRSTICPHSQAPLARRLEEARSRHLGEIIGNGIPCSKLPKKITRPRIFHPVSLLLTFAFPLCLLQPSSLCFSGISALPPCPVRFLCGEGDSDQRKRQGETAYNSPGACTHVTCHSDTDAKRAQRDILLLLLLRLQPPPLPPQWITVTRYTRRVRSPFPRTTSMPSTRQRRFVR